MEIYRITDPSDYRMERLLNLYLESFPESERRSISQINHLIENQSNMYFNAIENDNILCGFFVYWKLDEIYYMEYLAIFKEIRNMKIGENLLIWIDCNLEGLRIFEVEPPVDEITTRRVDFYKRNNYIVIDTHYKQPSYNGGLEEFPLWLMSNMKPNNLDQLIDVIKKSIYFSNI